MRDYTLQRRKKIEVFQQMTVLANTFEEARTLASICPEWEMQEDYNQHLERVATWGEIEEFDYTELTDEEMEEYYKGYLDGYKATIERATFMLEVATKSLQKQRRLRDNPLRVVPIDFD
jgi:hypothetical protein